MSRKASVNLISDSLDIPSLSSPESSASSTKTMSSKINTKQAIRFISQSTTKRKLRKSKSLQENHSLSSKKSLQIPSHCQSTHSQSLFNPKKSIGSVILFPSISPILKTIQSKSYLWKNRPNSSSSASSKRIFLTILLTFFPMKRYRHRPTQFWRRSPSVLKTNLSLAMSWRKTLNSLSKHCILILIFLRSLPRITSVICKEGFNPSINSSMKPLSKLTPMCQLCTSAVHLK